jgi:LacI family transcriptional regulator
MTITEIANAAGVSIATVSRYLNKGPVKEETRKKLESTILKLNYVPESMVHQIVNSPNQSIAVLTHSLTNYYTMEFSATLNEECTKRNIVYYTGCCTNGSTEYKYLIDLVSKGIGGIIIHDPALDQAHVDIYNQISQRHVPIVLVHSFPADFAYNTITVNQNTGMKKAMKYILGCGHKKIAFIRGNTGYSFDLKECIWREELKACGIEPETQDCIKINDSDEERGVAQTCRAVLDYFLAGSHPSIIFTCNDIMALGTIQALHQLGLSIPNDISLMSHDNTIIASAMNLTCVDMKTKSVAKGAMDLLDYAMHGNDTTPRHISITPELVTRTSVISYKSISALHESTAPTQASGYGVL